MNTKVKKRVLWSVIFTPMILGVYFLLGGYSALAAGPHGHGPRGMGPQGGFEGRHIMFGPHHGGGFSWLGFLLFLIIAIAVVVVFMRWLRRKAKASSMRQLIDTSMMSSHQPVMNQNAHLLDQWEKNLTNKKENV